MTNCKVLAQAKRGTDTITATRKEAQYDNFHNVRYEICISHDDGYAFLVISSARTTWKKTFQQIVDSYA